MHGFTVSTLLEILANVKIQAIYVQGPGGVSTLLEILVDLFADVTVCPLFACFSPP